MVNNDYLICDAAILLSFPLSVYQLVIISAADYRRAPRLPSIMPQRKLVAHGLLCWTYINLSLDDSDARSGTKTVRIISIGIAIITDIQDESHARWCLSRDFVAHAFIGVEHPSLTEEHMSSKATLPETQYQLGAEAEMGDFIRGMDEY